MATYETWALTLQALALIPAYGGMLLIFHGIRVMDRNATMRAADSERKHEENMTSLRELIAEQAESRASLRELIAGQEESRAAMREFIAEQAEGRAALRALIERTGGAQQ